MALADPQSIKVGETTTSLPRVNTGSFASEYTSADGTIHLKLSTQESTRRRQMLRVDISKITEDPFIDSQNREVSMSVYLVVDRPLVGYDNTEALAIIAALIELGTASTSKVLKQLLGGES